MYETGYINSMPMKSLSSSPRLLVPLAAILWTSVLLCGMVPAPASEDLLQNGDFEQPELSPLFSWERDTSSSPLQWRTFSSAPDAARIAITNEFSYSGKQSIVFVAPAVAEFHEGLAQEVGVTASQIYRYQVRVRAVPKFPLHEKARGQLSIEWVGGSGHEIERSWGPTWSGSDIAEEKWKLYQGEFTAPEGAVKANFVITCFSSEDSKGAFAIDAASFIPAK